jgi:hypothetical protein
MSIEHYDGARAKIARIHSRLNSQLDDIRHNQSYSESGRRVEMAKATLAARQEADALKAAFLAERETRRESLNKRLFGLSAPSPTELMVWRDSQDRAASLTNAEDAALKTEVGASVRRQLHVEGHRPGRSQQGLVRHR